MEIKCLEVRDRGTFVPVICIRPVAVNEAQRYLLQRDGYRADDSEHCVIYIASQCRGVAYDSYHWPANPRTHRVAHDYIQEHWHELKDGDVVDVEYIWGETKTRKTSERSEYPATDCDDPHHGLGHGGMTSTTTGPLPSGRDQD